MNGKAAKRIRIAAVHTYMATFKEMPLRRIYKNLKRGYKIKPYCRRDSKNYGGYVSHSRRIKNDRNKI